MKAKATFFLLVLLTVLTGCAQGVTELKPPEIRYGEDVCADCNMIISDARFATAYAYEVGPGRYQSVLFDDLADMLAYAAKHPEHKVVAWYVHDYESKEWTDATTASYVASERIATPMASGLVSFANPDRAEVMAYALGTQVMDWAALQAKQQAGELGAGMAGKVAMTGHGAAAGDALMQQPLAEHAALQGQEIVLGEADVEGYHVQLVTHTPLHAGYNQVMAHLAGPDGQPVAGATLTYTPTMAMLDGKHHTSPVEQPQETMPGMYHGAVGFSMPGGPDLGAWSLAVAFTDPATGAFGAATFPIEVAPSKLAGSFEAPDKSKIFLAAIQPPELAAVGKQPFEVFAFEKESMTEWPPLDDLVLEITPEMPTMGHGSPGNENPVSQGNGHYLGTVNFTMAGPWTVLVTAKRGADVLGQVEFEYQVR